MNVYDVAPTESGFFARCLERLTADMHFGAIKTGVLADLDQVAQVATLLGRLPDVPLVVDPVLVASSGGRLADSEVGRAIIDTLLARVTVLTPNAREASALCNDEPDLAVCGRRLAAHGTQVLITGGDTPDADQVINRLYDARGEIARYAWPRLPGVFHGSGCTLAASIAAALAAGRSVKEALGDGQARTNTALTHAFHAGRGQAIPNRLSQR